MNKVRVKLPSGKTGSIPEESLPDALKKGAVRLDENTPVGSSTMAMPQEDYTTMDSIKDGAVDASRGLAQGMTMGFSDELTAGMRALLNKKKEQSLKDAYNANLQEERTALHESSERSPWVYGASDIAGSVLPAIASGGASLLPLAGKESLRQVLKRGGAKALTSELGTIAAGSGAAGGVEALGRSEGTTNDAIAKDVMGGIALGAVAGPTFKAGSDLMGVGVQQAKGLLGGGDPTKQAPFVAQVGKAFQQGKEGKNISEALIDQERIGAEQIGHVKDIAGRFRTAEDKIAQEGKDMLEMASVDKKNFINIRPDVDEIAASVEGLVRSQPHLGSLKEIKQLRDRLSKVYSVVSPQEAVNLQKDIAKIASRSTNQEVKAVANELADRLEKQVDEVVPGLKQTNQALNDFKYAGSETITSKGLPREMRANVGPGVTEEKLGESITDLLSNLRTPGNSKADSVRTFAELKRQLEIYNNKYPGKLEKLGIDIDDLENAIVDKADEFAITRQALGSEPRGAGLARSATTGLIGSLAAAGRGKIVGAANIAGGITKKVAESAPAKTSQFLYQKSGDQLRGLADKLMNSNNSQAQYVAQSLVKALDDKNMIAKNAALFNILQNPELRDMIKDDLGLLEE